MDASSNASTIVEASTRSGLENALYDLKGGLYPTPKTPTELPAPPDTFLLFLASVDPGTGESWCPDCRESLPLLLDSWGRVTAKRAPEGGEGVPRPVLIKVWVGDRERWKSPNNPFRALPFGVACVPTLMKWDFGDLSKGINLGRSCPGRLGDQQCKDKELVEKLFGL